MNHNKQRWTITRIGLINFWHYDEQEFEFSDGKLLLRGANGSGKSVTMQSFIPLLFDGNKSPERLDPFGSRARKLENYLLGEDEKNKDESTGYLYMEFAKPDVGKYLTIGMGLRAKRARPVEFWGFSIFDGRRIGQDIKLYKEIGEKIPLTKTELRNRIGTGGEVTESQKEYMEMVNKCLFGFEDIEDYDELIKLLVQIRTPKLSKSYKPTVIYEIMNNSLQALSDDDLRPLSEAIENMDKIRDQLDMLQDSKKAADKLKIEYDKYNRFVLLEKSREFFQASERVDNANKDIDEQEKRAQEHLRLHNEAEEDLKTLELTRIALEHKKQQLEEHDAFKAQQEIVRLDAIIAEIERKLKAKEVSLFEKYKRTNQLNEKVKELNLHKSVQVDLIHETLRSMGELSKDFLFDEHEFTSAELKAELFKPFDFKLIKREIERYHSKITVTRKAIEQQKIKEQNYDSALKELENSRKERETAKREREKADNLFDETKNEFVEKFYKWESSNIHLKVLQEAKPQIVRLIQGYGDESSFDDIKGEARKHLVTAENSINKCILEHESLRKTYEERRREKQKELDEWKIKKDPEPERAIKTDKYRAKLSQLGIPYIPFYKAVDFRSETDALLRGRLEEALTDMGLLDALIIPNEFLSKLPAMPEDAGDKYIVSNPQFLAHEISTFLKPVVSGETEVSFGDIDNVLKSILIDATGCSAGISENGQYSIGLLNGNTTNVSVPKFLGIEARKLYRQQIINELTEEVQQIKRMVELEDEAIFEFKQIIKALLKEWETFPKRTDLETALYTLGVAKKVFDACESEVVRRQQQADKQYMEFKNAKEAVIDLSMGMHIPLNLDDYEKAEHSSTKYRGGLAEIEMQHSRLLNIVSNVLTIEEQIVLVLTDVEEFQGDIGSLKSDMEESKLRQLNYKEVLIQSDYESIKVEIEGCLNGLKEMPQRLETEIRKSQENKEKYQVSLSHAEKTLSLARNYETLRILTLESFVMEYDLGYVVKFEEKADSIVMAKKIISEFKTDEKGLKLRDEYTGSLHNRFRENMQFLAEYNLRIDSIFEKSDIAVEEAMTKILAQRKRLDLVAKVQGRDVDFYTMAVFVEQSIEENEKLLKESDRQLFEDILANTVGKKIRAKIYHSEQWVKKINNLMESMNTSSGLSFSLSWKKKTAEAEEQLDTKELVELLQSDAVLLTEEDMSRLTQHFRSKIAQARKRMEDTGNVQSFHTIMKEILDYRKWFEFQLFYKKTGEIRKELTDNAFYKFSGGEKAMAMYVPLFSSVYAKFDGASYKDCPRVISLDEAFAGVDDNNIADMFRLVDELKLDYLMNSQILWGDYDTVPSLSIYELIRPNNADFVTTIRYIWNGKTNKLLG